jgi:hypothetical protein
MLNNCVFDRKTEVRLSCDQRFLPCPPVGTTVLLIYEIILMVPVVEKLFRYDGLQKH